MAERKEGGFIFKLDAAWVYENRQRLWDGLKAYQGLARNARTIVTTVVQRAAEKVTWTVAEAAKSVTGFFELMDQSA